MFWKDWFLRNKRVYADAAAATPLSQKAQSELVRLLSLFGNASALHKEGVAAKKELECARQRVAKSIGAHPDEIVFTSGGTEANNLAITGVWTAGSAVTSAVEHASVLEPLRALGMPLLEVGVSNEGLVDPKKIQEALTPDSTFVSIQLVNSELGTIQPIREIAKVIRKQNKKVYLHTDASQAPLWLDLKVERLGVDLMTLDGQKILGPKGVGCLYVKRGTPLSALHKGGGQESGRRAGTENVPLIGAFAVALEDAQTNVEERVTQVGAVRDFLKNKIKTTLPDAICNGPLLEHQIPNTINVSIPQLASEMAVLAMDAQGIAVSTRSACDEGEEEASHVLRAIGLSPELSGTAIRITLLPDTSKKDASFIAARFAKIAKRYRKVL